MEEGNGIEGRTICEVVEGGVERFVASLSHCPTFFKMDTTRLVEGCVFMCMCLHVCVCMCMCVHVCLRVCLGERSFWDDGEVLG